MEPRAVIRIFTKIVVIINISVIIISKIRILAAPTPRVDAPRTNPSSGPTTKGSPVVNAAVPSNSSDQEIFQIGQEDLFSRASWMF